MSRKADVYWMQKVDKVKDECVSRHHPGVQGGSPLGCIVHMQHIQILVPGHLPRCNSSRPIYQQVEAPIVVPAAISTLVMKAQHVIAETTEMEAIRSLYTQSFRANHSPKPFWQLPVLA